MHLLTGLLFRLFAILPLSSTVCPFHPYDNTLQAAARTSTDRYRLWRLYRRGGRRQTRLHVRTTIAECTGHRHRLEPQPRLGWGGPLCVHFVPLDIAIQDHEIQPTVGNDLMIQNKIQQSGRLQRDVNRIVVILNRTM